MLSKTDAEGVRAHNRRIVIEHLRVRRRTTRRAAADATGLSLSSAAAITSALIRNGLVREIPEAEEDAPLARVGRRGRPERRIALLGEAAYVIAARVAVGEIAVRLSDYAGTSLAEATRETSIAGFDADAIAGVIAALIETVASEARLASCDRIGRIGRIVVAVQGKVDTSRGSIVWSPALKTRNIEIGPAIEARTGIGVGVENDCSLMPEGFRWDGSSVRSGLATILIGFGVGMGIAVAGDPFTARQRASTEFGHINHYPGGALCRCGNRGCVEAYAADYAILRSAGGAPPDEIIARRIDESLMHAIADRARAGEAQAAGAFETAGLALGYGLGRVFTLIDPLPLVFTGSGSHAMDLLEPSIRRGIAESAVAGEGADVPFTVVEDADALIFDAATNRALGDLDQVFAASERETRDAAE
ncbi:ROK family protein [Fulvimarina endophytica]|uniref:ROK family protein n=1 Tax=Fulvimarina endophytica TaxID=2293836 RepID=A0A371X2K8_9HYPH|nr:ROK family protein [Fulvimarina endophytica]RFC63457.1 ROK family protein [Fulvimarina endophytica]